MLIVDSMNVAVRPSYIMSVDRAMICVDVDCSVGYTGAITLVSCVGFFFFKQKTGNELSACLVGSEVCIRDSCRW